jgi:hypothetical protein
VHIIHETGHEEMNELDKNETIIKIRSDIEQLKDSMKNFKLASILTTFDCAGAVKIEWIKETGNKILFLLQTQDGHYIQFDRDSFYRAINKIEEI